MESLSAIWSRPHGWGTGDIPQNINFAISAGTVRAFLDAQNVPYETEPSPNKLEPADVAAKARRFTVPVECWR